MNSALPPLRDVIARHELRAKRSLGQNFLLDLNLTDRIARAAGAIDQHTVIEVGPGPGGLTRSLLDAGARRVIAIERDQRCLGALAEIAEHYPGRLTVIEGDALTVDFGELADGPTRVVANLPYNIATPLLTGWLTGEAWPPWYESLTLMFQREVAERIAATTGDKAYGRLGVLCGWRSHAQIMFDVAPSNFVPPPKVTSAIVHLEPRADPLPCRSGDLAWITAAAFGQRRKMLRQSLKSLGLDTPELLSRAGVDGTRRAEELDIQQFVELANQAAALKA